MKAIDEREKQKKKKKAATTKTEKNKGDKSYSKRVRGKWFCCAFKLSFLQLICKASLFFKLNLELPLSIILKEKELYESKHFAVFQITSIAESFVGSSPTFKLWSKRLIHWIWNKDEVINIKTVIGIPKTFSDIILQFFFTINESFLDVNFD